MGGVVLGAHNTQTGYSPSFLRWKDGDLHPHNTVWENVTFMTCEFGCCLDVWMFGYLDVCLDV